MFNRQRKIPVACIQLRAHDRDGFDAALPRIVTLVCEAARRGAELIVLPEATVPGYVLGMEPVRAEQLARAADAFGTCARTYGATIVYGGAVLAGERTFNAAIAIGPDGREAGRAAKQFLWHFDRRWFSAGDTLEPVDTPLGKLGLLVCADGRIPTIAATLVDRGAELLVMPTAWVTSGRDPLALENLQADLMAVVRAKENGVPFAIANKCGVERESVAYCGKSALIDERGCYVARGSERDESIVSGEVTLGARPPGPRAARSAAAAQTQSGERPGARIAFTSARGKDANGFVAAAAQADADFLLAREPLPSESDVVVIDTGSPVDRLYERGGLRLCSVGDTIFCAPRGLVAARLAGAGLVLWNAEGDPAWHVPFARTRAAELRTYVVAFATGGRAFAVDPDGNVIAGTFDDYRLASFAYDIARIAATTVAPTTDVLAGLRTAEAISAD